MPIGNIILRVETLKPIIERGLLSESMKKLKYLKNPKTVRFEIILIVTNRFLAFGISVLFSLIPTTKSINVE